MNRLSTLILSVVFLLSPMAHAEKFANQFVEFELPPQWRCNLEGAEWVCQSLEENKKRDAIIVLAAKIKGDQDSLEAYMAHVKNSKAYTSIQGKSISSEVKYAKNININDHTWVDSLHLEAEIPGFYTRYLATVKTDIGVLVTYSINKLKYQQYLGDFETMVNTLKVFRKPGAVNLGPQSGNLFNAGVPQSVSGDTIFPGIAAEGGAPKPKPQKESFPMLPVVVIAGAIGWFIWKKRQDSDS